MGTFFLDEYSLLHLASGILVQYWSMPFWVWILVHVIYEWAENTGWGMSFITNTFTLWPGGKDKADSVINRVGDIVWGAVGWGLAYAYREKI
jgi:hypothetical protein